MTAMVARLLLAILIFPLSLIVFFLTAGAIISLGGGPSGRPTLGGILSIWATTYIFIAVYWVYVWRASVNWSRSRAVGTAIAGAIAILCAVPLYLVVGFVAREPLVAVMASGALPPVVWVLLTILLWRETPAERLERLRRRGPDTVACPVCGYNMTGLREAKCPECGGSFRLEELATGQALETPEGV